MPEDGIEFVEYDHPRFIENPTLAEIGRKVHALITKYGAFLRFQEQLALWDKGFSQQIAAEVEWRRKREEHQLWGITQSRWLDEKAGPPEPGCNFEGFRLIEPPDKKKPGRSGPRLGLWFRLELCSRNCPEAELPLPPRQGKIELHAKYAVFAAIFDHSMKGQQRLGDGLGLDHFDMLTGLESPLPDDDRNDGLILQIPASDEGYLRIWLDDIEGDLQARAAEGLATTGYAHSSDFRSVVWRGNEFSFTKQQAPTVKTLWEAWENRTPDVGTGTLLEAAAAETSRLIDGFRDHPAWGTMIIDGKTTGTKRIAGDPPQS